MIKYKTVFCRPWVEVNCLKRVFFHDHKISQLPVDIAKCHPSPHLWKLLKWSMEYQGESQESGRGSLHIPSLASTHIKNLFVWASCPHSANDAKIQQELQRADRAGNKSVSLESLSQSSVYFKYTLKTPRTKSSIPALLSEFTLKTQESPFCLAGIYNSNTANLISTIFLQSSGAYHLAPCLASVVTPHEDELTLDITIHHTEDICYLSAASLLQVSLNNKCH